MCDFLPLSFIEELLLLILAQTLIGAGIYIVGVKVLKFEMFDCILGTVKERAGKKLASRERRFRSRGLNVLRVVDSIFSHNIFFLKQLGRIVQ